MIKASTQRIPMGLARGINDYGILEARLGNVQQFKLSDCKGEGANNQFYSNILKSTIFWNQFSNLICPIFHKET